MRTAWPSGACELAVGLAGVDHPWENVAVGTVTGKGDGVGAARSADDRSGRSGPACECGHDRIIHQHARTGLDCGVCGPDVCPEYRRRPMWLRTRRVFTPGAVPRPVRGTG